MPKDEKKKLAMSASLCKPMTPITLNPAEIVHENQTNRNLAQARPLSMCSEAQNSIHVVQATGRVIFERGSINPARTCRQVIVQSSVLKPSSKRQQHTCHCKMRIPKQHPHSEQRRDYYQQPALLFRLQCG